MWTARRRKKFSGPLRLYSPVSEGFRAGRYCFNASSATPRQEIYVSGKDRSFARIVRATKAATLQVGSGYHMRAACWHLRAWEQVLLCLIGGAVCHARAGRRMWAKTSRWSRTMPLRPVGRCRTSERRTRRIAPPVWSFSPCIHLRRCQGLHFIIDRTAARGQCWMPRRRGDATTSAQRPIVNNFAGAASLFGNLYESVALLQREAAGARV